ncbi:Selenocysteine-specific elongation factor [Sporotomaculum syntrophicum]|uniref:Selenocysteine-specific elongation factor n=1 Tax=Sporotomaculum syntrophicum TaxID=182264 RepID=A0A9D2WQR5_9FIRM|nr:Selenocysteine-specific elongation factor [Sporotomaculum syntrophicum]
MDTDRLKEEKERGISIELGFAYLKLNNGRTVGIIDVPGHERFIKNMLAGVGGIDIVLLVIAADEGVMPQTREHLDIIQLLKVDRGVVVITKKDLVDEEWLEMVIEDTRDFVKDTVLENAPLVSVSAIKGEGLDELLKVINQLAVEAEQQAKKYNGPPRLPVDRVFTITGFGTVATGTLLSGQINTGDTLQIYPNGGTYRVRNIQVHGQKVQTAEAGQRVAINLSGLETGVLERGRVLAAPGSMRPTHRLDVKLQYLASAPKPLKNRARVRVYLGSAELLGRVILLDREELEPGAEAFIQLQMEESVASARGDHMVIRSYSPMRTIGGGVVVEPNAIKHKRYREELIKALSTAEKGTPGELLEQYLAANARLCTKDDLVSGTGLTTETVLDALSDLLEQGDAVELAYEGEKTYLSVQVLAKWEDKLEQALVEYHKKFPLREGYPKEELRSRLFPALSNKHFQMLLLGLEQSGNLELQANSVAIYGFTPTPSSAQSIAIKQLEEFFLANPYQPPGWSEAVQEVGLTKDEQEVLNYLLNQGTLVKVADGMFFHQRALAEILALVKNHLAEKGELMLGELRDILQTSRKYALPLLEYMDKEKITRRVGDKRVAGRALSQ